MHTIASTLICSVSNSRRVRTSRTRILKLLFPSYSRSVSGNSAVGNSRFSGVVCGMSGDLCPPFNERFDGFLGTAGASGDRGAGELGRLLKVSIFGIGVLDGRGPGSMGSAGNCLANRVVGEQFDAEKLASGT